MKSYFSALVFLFSVSSLAAFQPQFQVETKKTLIEADGYFLGPETVLLLRRSSRSEQWMQVPRSEVVRISRVCFKSDSSHVRSRPFDPVFHFLDADDYDRSFVCSEAPRHQASRATPDWRIKELTGLNVLMAKRIRDLEKKMKSEKVEGENARLDLSSALNEIVSLKLNPRNGKNGK
jgi:hypothetical protein